MDLGGRQKDMNAFLPGRGQGFSRRVNIRFHRTRQAADNTAFNIAKRILGEEKILAVMADINLPSALFTDDESTPEDVGYFWKLLYGGDYVSEETKDALLGYMTDTIYENWIAKDIPVRVAHKYGTLIHIRNDAGIVYAQKPYVLVVMSKGIVEKDADVVIPHISNYIYQIMTSSN